EGPERHRSAARRKTIPAAHGCWGRCKRRGRLVSHRAPATPPTTRRVARKIARNLAVDRHPRRLRAWGKAYDSDARTRAELMGSPYSRSAGASSVHRLRGGVQSKYRRKTTSLSTSRESTPTSPIRHYMGPKRPQLTKLQFAVTNRR